MLANKLIEPHKVTIPNFKKETSIRVQKYIFTLHLFLSLFTGIFNLGHPTFTQIRVTAKRATIEIGMAFEALWTVASKPVIITCNSRSNNILASYKINNNIHIIRIKKLGPRNTFCKHPLMRTINRGGLPQSTGP